MFSDTPEGATASAVVYSIVSSARANGVVPQKYLAWLLSEMPNTESFDDEVTIDRFMPWSAAVPQECRMAPEESRLTPDDPIIDIDPHEFEKK